MPIQRGIEAYIQPGTKEETLPVELDQLPCNVAIIGNLLAHCPVVLTWSDTDCNTQSLPFNDDGDPKLVELPDVSLQQVSLAHGRSFEVRSPDIPHEWSLDGHRYRGLSIKGVNMIFPHAIAHPSDPENAYMAYGLQDDKSIGRALRASRVMRERGIATEYVVGMAELPYLPVAAIGLGIDHHTLHPSKEVNAAMVDEHLESLPNDQRTKAVCDRLAAAFDDVVYLATLRATDSPYRLHDVRYEEPRAQIFTLINNELLRPGDAPLDARCPQDIQRYVKDYWAPTAARHLAMLHVDLCHRYLHGSNYTALGGIVDLDSVRGEALGLGDKPITQQDRMDDLIYTFDAISKLVADDLAPRQVDTSIHTAFIRCYSQYANQLAAEKGEVGQADVMLLNMASRLPHLQGGNNRATEAISSGIVADFIMKHEGLAAIPERAYAAVDQLAEHLLQDEQELVAHAGSWELSFDAVLDILAPNVAEAVAKAQKAGQVFDIMQAFEDTASLEKVAHDLFGDEVGRWLDVTLEERLLAAAPDLVPEFAHFTLEETYRYLWRKAIYDRGHTYNTQIIERCVSIMDALGDELSAGVNHTIPDQLLESTDARSHYFTGLADGHYWRAVEHVPYALMMDRLGRQDKTLITTVPIPKNVDEADSGDSQQYDTDDDADDADKRWRLRVDVSTGGVRTSEIISDAEYNILPGRSDAKDHQYEIAFVTDPQYVLVVTDSDTDGRRYQLYVSNSQGPLDTTIPLF